MTHRYARYCRTLTSSVSLRMGGRKSTASNCADLFASSAGPTAFSALRFVRARSIRSYANPCVRLQTRLSRCKAFFLTRLRPKRRFWRVGTIRLWFGRLLVSCARIYHLAIRGWKWRTRWSDKSSVTSTITRVGHLVSRSGFPQRTLQRLLTRYVGASAQWIIKRYRIYDALEMLDGRKPFDWATLAQDLGYFDQAHFINDFKKLVGCAPAVYARRLSSRPAIESSSTINVVAGVRMSSRGLVERKR